MPKFTYVAILNFQETKHKLILVIANMTATLVQAEKIFDRGFAFSRKLMAVGLSGIIAVTFFNVNMIC